MKTNPFRNLLLTALALAGWVTGATAAGDLDTSFNVGTGPSASVRSVKLQTDGKVLIGGEFTSVNGAARQFIARLNANGSLDTGFNAGPNNRVWSVAAQTDGQVLIGGDFNTANGAPRPFIARLFANGGLDFGFFANPGPNDTVYSVALQSDGKVLIGGQFTSVGGATRHYIARLNANGSLDTSFVPASGANGRVWSVEAQSDGKVLIGGEFTVVNGVTRQYIARLNANGSLDTSFAPTPGANSAVYSVASQSNGKVLIGGLFNIVNGISSPRVARLHGVENFAPTDISLSNASIAENLPSSAKVGSFTATDPNSGDTHTFTLVSGTGDTDNANFSISNSTNLTTAGSFDFETQSSYSIRVRATDNRGLFVEEAFTITVIDGSDACGVVPANIVSWWRAEGDVSDDIGSSDGAMQGATFASGVTGQSFSFDGVDDYVSIPAPFTAFTTQITVEYWYYYDGSIKGAWLGQGSESVDNMANNVWLMHAADFGGVTWYVNDNGTWRNPPVVNMGSTGWHHVAGVADSTSLRIYVNGWRWGPVMG